ncbi:MAG: citrate transporter [Verrucomicrobiota bacterium]|nr:citrate transporter [Verrucomicrobiota bacterium]
MSPDIQLGLSVSPAIPLGANLFGIPIDFVLFGLTLLGVALFHHHTLRVALIGTGTIALYQILFTGFTAGPGLGGFGAHLAHEWVILANLLCLLTGFALLSRHFEKSHVPVLLPKYLPADWKGGFVLLVIVWVLSSFLDNIAGALIGGAMAHQLFRSKVHIGFIAAIVAASNAGGAWSVVGDTTTTMMWIAGISPARVFEAIVPAAVALFVFGIPAALQQQKYSPILGRTHEHTNVDWLRIGIVAFILALAIATNVTVNLWFTSSADHFPFIGVAVWVAILASIPFRRPDWELLPRAIRGSIFLLALVLAASMMPVHNLPLPSWGATLGLGFLSAVFDNIPLTALALKQGGYDWGFLAYTVGFGGSMVWFGSSSGVALCNMFPEARSLGQWLRHGWAIPIAYVVGFFVMLSVWRWHPDPPRSPRVEPAAALQPSS